MKDNYEFKGWDWTELAPVMGMEEELKEIASVPKDYMKLEAVLGKEMASKMLRYPDEHTEEETELFIKHLRTFLQLIVDMEHMGHYKPYYEGILKTENNDVFLSVYSRNLTSMWT